MSEDQSPSTMLIAPHATLIVPNWLMETDPVRVRIQTWRDAARVRYETEKTGTIREMEAARAAESAAFDRI